MAPRSAPYKQPHKPAGIMQRITAAIRKATTVNDTKNLVGISQSQPILITHFIQIILVSVMLTADPQDQFDTDIHSRVTATVLDTAF